MSTTASSALSVNPEWDKLFVRAVPGSDIQVSEKDSPLERKCQIIFSLIIYLNITIRDLLLFMFSSNIKVVRHRVGMFMGFRGPESFGPKKIFELWVDNFPKSRPYLNEYIIQPGAKAILIEESDTIIDSPAYRVKPKECTTNGIRDVLHPGKLSGLYQNSAPFTWDLLLAVITAPNEYRKRKARAAMSQSHSDEQFEDSEDSEEDEELEGNINPRSKAKKSEWRHQGFRRNPVFTLVFVMSMLAFTRNSHTNLFPLIFGLFLEIGGTSSRVMTTLSHAGACVSITTIERLKKILSDDAKDFAVQLMKGPTQYYCIFDNINIFLRKSQQRRFNQNTMINATNAVIISLPDALPDAQNLQTKLDNRGKRRLAEGKDILPTQEDSLAIKGSFEGLVAHLLIAYCPGNEKWKDKKTMLENADQKMANDRPLPVKKTDARPLGVFDVNEGSKKGIIEMVKALQVASTLSEDQWSSQTRIIAGDWLTTSNFRSARRDRAGDLNSMERLEYSEDLSQLFHFALNASHMLMRLHFGNTVMDPGSLAKHKGILGRTWDASKPNYADGKALIKHSLIARILYSLMLDQKFLRWSQLADYDPTPAQIAAFAADFVQKYTRADKAKAVGDDYLAHSIYFIRDALIFFEFEHAVSHADAGRVLRVLKFWALSFRGAGLHNYARECLEILLRWKFELDPSLRSALEQSWFVNRWGLPGRWIAADLYVEQLNYWVKRVFIAKGAGVTLHYIMEKGSACVEAFREISHLFAQTFGHADRARRHSEVRIDQDVRVLCEHMLNARLHIQTPNRQVLGVAKVDNDGKITTTAKSCIFDSLEVGATILNDGKFSEFILTTSWDPAHGYPIDILEMPSTIPKNTPSTIPDDTPPTVPDNTPTLTDTVYDKLEINPISIDEFNDIDDGDNNEQRCPGLGGSLGGGIECAD